MTLTVFDLAGREVQRLADGHQDAGWHVSEWTGWARDGLRANAGIYFIRLSAVPVDGGSPFTAFGKAMRLD